MYALWMNALLGCVDAARTVCTMSSPGPHGLRAMTEYGPSKLSARTTAFKIHHILLQISSFLLQNSSFLIQNHIILTHTNIVQPQFRRVGVIKITSLQYCSKIHHF